MSRSSHAAPPCAGAASTAVYAADDGRPFLGEGYPAPPVPITESRRTVAPDAGVHAGGTYGGGTVALEEAWLGSAVPVTLARSGAVHGRRATNPREWFALRRALDGRTDVVLAHGAASRFQPVAATNLAEPIRLAAAQPADRVLNGGCRAVTTYAEALPDEVAWMRRVTADRDWREAFGDLAAADARTPMFDDAAEDAWIGQRHAHRGGGERTP